jgi:hypothetical protein
MRIFYAAVCAGCTLLLKLWLHIEPRASRITYVSRVYLEHSPTGLSNHELSARKVQGQCQRTRGPHDDFVERP